MRGIQRADYEQPDGTALVAGSWLEVMTEAGTGRGKFSGLMTRELGQYAYLDKFRSFTNPEPVRLVLHLDDDGRNPVLDGAKIVAGHRRVAVMPAAGDFVLYTPAKDPNHYDRLGIDSDDFPWSWDIGRVLYAGPGTKLFDLRAVLLVIDENHYAPREELITFDQVRARGRTREEVWARREELRAAIFDKHRAYDRELRTLRHAVNLLFKEAIPT